MPQPNDLSRSLVALDQQAHPIRLVRPRAAITTGRIGNVAADPAALQVEEACRRFDTQTTGKSVFLI